MHDQRERLVEVDRRYAHLIVRAARCVCGEVEPDLVRPRARPGMLVLVVAEVVETVPVMDVHGIGAARGEPFLSTAWPLGVFSICARPTTPLSVITPV